MIYVLFPHHIQKTEFKYRKRTPQSLAFYQKTKLWHLYPIPIYIVQFMHLWSEHPLGRQLFRDTIHSTCCFCSLNHICVYYLAGWRFYVYLRVCGQYHPCYCFNPIFYTVLLMNMWVLLVWGKNDLSVTSSMVFLVRNSATFLYWKLNYWLSNRISFGFNIYWG